MLLSIFSALYELVCGVNKNYPEYRQQIFNSVGLLTVIIALAICIIFYVVLGRWKMVWYNNVHWGFTIVICAVICFLLAFLTTKNVLGLVDGYLWLFAIFNAVYSVIYFVIFSFLFKKFSIFSKRTPI